MNGSQPALESSQQPKIERPAILGVVMQHVEEVAHLRHVRTTLVRAPHIRLMRLGRADERLAAHLDGVAVAGACGVAMASQVLEHPGVGQVFLAAVRAIEDRDSGRLDQVLALGENVPACRAGALSAFGWVAAADLQGLAKGQLEGVSPWRREVGLTTCAMHSVNPGPALANAISDADASLRACALRGAGRAGGVDLLDLCLAHLTDDDPHCAFEAARSALLLGDRTESIRALEALTLKAPDEDRRHALGALSAILKVISPKRAQALLASLAKDPTRIRLLLQGIAMAGDPHYIPWLIAQMQDLKLARLAGEAFSFITGLDLAYLDLELKPLRNLEFGPNADASDDNIAMDEDDSLPCPDPDKVAAWWQKNGASFAPGTRYFMGAPPTREHCVQVLKTGYQRQRIASAEYRSLLAPGTPLFNVAAPAWRQQRLLARMT